jgi:DNA modification methylase
MAPECINCIVTSPPYWGLRDYGVAGQIGLEAKLDDYVAEMVAIFREARRALRPDGTLWLNLGDSYAGSGKGGNPEHSEHIKQKTNEGSLTVRDRVQLTPELKPKDLCGIPWRVAFALQADGWYLRQDIIWHKPNPMPESVTDRCTKAHEYLFLLSKSEKYYYDAKAIKEPAAQDEFRPTFRGGSYCNNSTFNNAEGGKSTVVGNVRRGRAAGNKSHKGVTEYEASDTEEHRTKAGLLKIAATAYLTRNKRSVWTVGSAPFREAHFATFPPALIEPAILAGCPPGGVVLDPFGGAGTTALVATRLGRRSITMELNPAYVEMAERRLAR